MLIRDMTFASASQVSANLADHLSTVNEGRRVLVVNDEGHYPIAALVGLDDLRRISEDEIDVVETPLTTAAAAVGLSTLLAASPPGYTPIGVRANGSPVIIPVRAHHAIVARDGFGGDMLLTSAIAGAALDPATPNLGLLLATAAGNTGLPDRLLNSPTVVSCQTSLADEARLARFVDQFSAEVRSRQKLLRRNGARSVDELGRTRPDDLVAVIDGAGVLLDINRELGDLIGEILVSEGALGVYLWVVTPTPLRSIMGRMVSYAQFNEMVTSRIVLQTFSPQHSKDVIGISAGATLGRGFGFCKPDRTSAAQHFHVPAITDADLAESALESQPRPRIRWADPLPESISLEDTVTQWAAIGGLRNCAEVPIGLVDDIGRHQIIPYTVTFDEKLRVMSITGTDPDHVANALDVITTAAAATNDATTLRFVYIGPPPNGLRPLWTMPNVDVFQIGDERIIPVITGLQQRLQIGGDGGHVVLIIDGWKDWYMNSLGRRWEGVTDIVGDLTRRGAPAGIHVLVTNSGNSITYRLDGVVDERIELRSEHYFSSELDRDAAKRIPDDKHRGLTQRGPLLLASI